MADEQLPSYLRPIIAYLKTWLVNELQLRGIGTRYISGGSIRGGVTPSAHASSHEDGGADEITLTNLSSGAATDGYVLTADGAGGAAWEETTGGSLTVKEADDAPSVADVTTIIVSNGKLTDNGGGSVSLDLSGDAGSPDASTVTYTPTVATDWDGDADPGNVDGALDQLAERVDDLEGAGGGGDSVYTAAYASRPAASNDGDLFLPSNGFVVERDTGAAWAPWGPLFPFTAPADGDFSWLNQGAATVDTTYGGIWLSIANESGDHLHGRVKAVPGSTPCTVTAALLEQAYSGATVGLYFYNSSSGKLMGICAGWGSATRLEIQKWNNTDSFNTVMSKDGRANPLWFFRLTDDGTNLSFHWSTNGQYFTQQHSESRATFLGTPTHWGFVVWPRNAGDTGTLLLSWTET